MYDSGDDYMCRWVDMPSRLAFFLTDLPGDDWLPAIAPTFPELPPKPPQCLARAKGFARYDWYTRAQVTGQFIDPFGSRYLAESLAVIPHSDNDPEAVRLIEEANKNARQ